MIGQRKISNEIMAKKKRILSEYAKGYQNGFQYAYKHYHEELTVQELGTSLNARAKDPQYIRGYIIGYQNKSKILRDTNAGEPGRKKHKTISMQTDIAEPEISSLSVPNQIDSVDVADQPTTTTTSSTTSMLALLNAIDAELMTVDDDSSDLNKDYSDEEELKSPISLGCEFTVSPITSEKECQTMHTPKEDQAPKEDRGTQADVLEPESTLEGFADQLARKNILLFNTDAEVRRLTKEVENAKIKLINLQCKR